MSNNDVNKACDRAVTELAAGNKQALSVIYDHMARMIFSVAISIVKNYHDAEEILQDTFIEIVKYAGSYKQGSNAKAWILTIARHLSIDVMRKKTPLYIDDAEDGAPELAAESGEFSSLEVFDMLNLLDENSRQVIVYRLYTGLSYKEISKVMDVTVASAQKKYHRALKKLKAEHLKN